MSDGTLDTSGSNYGLTVDGEVYIKGGTLTLNGSTCEFGVQNEHQLLIGL